MKDLKDNNICSNGGELLGYLYEEMPAADREIFELHLGDCGTCIDDFADISQARYPVFEWKTLEFDPMRTPRFVMPVEPASIGFFDRWRAAFAMHREFAFGGAAAAVLVVVLAGYAFYLQNGTEADVAVVEPVPIASQVQKVISAVTPEANSSRTDGVAEPNAITQKSTTKRPAPAKASASKMKPTEPVRNLEVKVPVLPRKQVRPIPVFSIAEDDEDETLRLADMFDEIGAS